MVKSANCVDTFSQLCKANVMDEIVTHLEKVENADLSDSSSEKPFWRTVDASSHQQTCSDTQLRSSRAELKLLTAVRAAIDSNLTRGSVFVVNQVFPS